MNKTTAAFAAIILVVAVLVAYYGVYRLDVPYENDTRGDAVTIVSARKIGELIGFSTKIAVAEALKKHDG